MKKREFISQLSKICKYNNFILYEDIDKLNSAKKNNHIIIPVFYNKHVLLLYIYNNRVIVYNSDFTEDKKKIKSIFLNYDLTFYDFYYNDNKCCEHTLNFVKNLNK